MLQGSFAGLLKTAGRQLCSFSFFVLDIQLGTVMK